MKGTFRGGCQCGKVRFEAKLDFEQAIACNCSRCRRLGSLLAFTPKEGFTLLAGAGETTEYLFHRRVVHHHFCRTCGIQPFAEGVRPDGAEVVAVNVRCLDDVDIEAIPVRHYDGRAL